MNIDLNSITMSAMSAITSIPSQPKGLHNFISEIRNCKSKEDERSRVDKELANIRKKFAASANLTSYDKKKYIWKLCYIYMLGYEIDFGHTEFISLLGSTKFQEKSVGYMAFSLMLRPGDEMMTLVVNSIRNDIIGQLHHGKTLALAAVANIGGTDLAEALAGDVQRVITNALDAPPSYNPNITVEMEERNRCLLVKKACLCLLKLFQSNPDCIILEDWVTLLARLLEDRDLGVIISVMSLLQVFVAQTPSLFESLVPYVISILTRLVTSRTCGNDYLYYRTPSPWLQVKCLRLLEYYKLPADKTQQDLLTDILRNVLNNTEVSESNNKNNADHSILFEAIHLIISYGPDAPLPLKEQCCGLLGRFIAVNDANIRYLGLETMTRLAKLDGPGGLQSHQSTVLDSVKDGDISVRKRALNLIYVLTDVNNAKPVVEELLVVLGLADSAIKEDMVVKIAILAEKFSTDLQWYINTMVQVILVAGDFVAEAVWYRIVQVVVSSQQVDIHEYVAEKLLHCVESKWTHETIVALAAYLLGEIGVNICEQPAMSGHDQFVALHQHFGMCSVKTQCILLTTYMKLLNLYPEQIKDLVVEVFTKYSTNSNLELQQRACEYLALPTLAPETMEAVLNTMPPYELESKQNALLTIEMEADNRNAVADAEPKEVGYESTLRVTKPVQGATQDLLSMDDESPVPQTTMPTSSGAESIAPHLSETVKQLLLAASLVRGAQAKSTLLENEILLVSISADYRMNQGRLALFLNNHTGSPLQNVKASILTNEEMFRVQQQNPPSDIAAGEEARMQIAVECLTPMSLPSGEFAPITVKLQFHLQNSNYEYLLKLPVTLGSFIQPVEGMDKNTYLAQWKEIQGPETEAQVIFDSKTPVSPELLAKIRSEIVPGAMLRLAAGLDNEKTVTCCGSFAATPGSGGAPVGLLTRLESDPNTHKFRLTARSSQPGLAATLKDFFMAHLAK